MYKWEQYYEATLEIDKWVKMAKFASKAYINTSLIQVNYKILLRWYMVPVRVATYVPGTFPLFHGIWHRRHSIPYMVDMPIIRRFWICIYNFIFSLTQVNLIKSPQQGLLGSPVEGVPGHMNKRIIYPSRIVVARSWKGTFLLDLGCVSGLFNLSLTKGLHLPQYIPLAIPLPWSAGRTSFS